MNVNNENKLQELSLYVNINLNNMNIQKQQNAKTYNKDNNSLNNINKIKRKVNIMNYNQRELQSRISDIQIQEAKIEEMEKTLQDAKNIYSENIKNEKIPISFIRLKSNSLNLNLAFNFSLQYQIFIHTVKIFIIVVTKTSAIDLYPINNNGNTKNGFTIVDISFTTF